MNTSNFYPYQNNQTVALFLFDKDLNRETWFDFNIHFSSAHYDSNGEISLMWIYREKGENIDSDLRNRMQIGTILYTSILFRAISAWLPFKDGQEMMAPRKVLMLFRHLLKPLMSSPAHAKILIS